MHATASFMTQEKNEESARRSLLWKKALLGTSVVLIVGVMWRAVYVSNQRELNARRALRKSQQLYDALNDVPARRFSTQDVRPAAAQKNELLERYA